MTLKTDRFNEIYENPEQCSYSEIQEMAAMLANREAQPVGFYTTVSGRKGVVWHNGAPEDDTAIYTAPPAPAVQKDVEAVVGLLESGEWAEHCTNTELGQRLESAVTALMTNAPPAPAVPIPDKVSCEGFDPKDWVEARNLGQCEGWNAYRAEMLAQPASQGYKLVPVEPTEEMIAAAMNCDDVEFNSDETFCVNFDNIYRAMLAAAPEGGN